MDGIGLVDLWWCWDCGQVVRSVYESDTGYSYTKLATYYELCDGIDQRVESAGREVSAHA